MKNILMTAPVTLSTQQGIKTQTRRIDKRLPSGDVEVKTQIDEQGRCFVLFDGQCFPLKYRIGEVLWVREPADVYDISLDYKSIVGSYRSDRKHTDMIEFPERLLRDGKLPDWAMYREGIPNGCIREMARTFIRITNIRVERLNEISEEGAIAEGISEVGFIPDDGFPMCSGYMFGKDDGKTTLKTSAKECFKDLWESISGKDSFDNRWVAVYEYELVSKEDGIK